MDNTIEDCCFYSDKIGTATIIDSNNLPYVDFMDIIDGKLNSIENTLIDTNHQLKNTNEILIADKILIQAQKEQIEIASQKNIELICELSYLRSKIVALTKEKDDRLFQKIKRLFTRKKPRWVSLYKELQERLDVNNDLSDYAEYREKIEQYSEKIQDLASRYDED